MRVLSFAAFALVCLTGCATSSALHSPSLDDHQTSQAAALTSQTTPSSASFSSPSFSSASFSSASLGSDSPIQLPPSNPIVSPTDDAAATPYHAYGDSITFGYALPDKTQNYASLFAAAKSLDLTDHAIPGDQACDVPSRQIFPNADSPALFDNTLYSLLISTNDVDVRGSGAYENVFNLCHQATLSWLAVPAEFKIFPTSFNFVASGATVIDNFNNWNALILQGHGAAVDVTFHRKNVGPVYVWYRIGDGNAGAFSYALDGNILGNLTTATNPSLHTYNGSYDSFALLRIPDIAPGRHTLTITQTSFGTYDVGIIAVASLPNAPRPGFPRVLVGTTPMQYNGWDVPCNSPTSAPCAAYISDITNNVNLLAGDGLNIQLFNSRKYMSGSAADMTDAVHPNNAGHQEILHALADVF